MNIPNILTAARFVLIPFFGYYLYTRQYYLAVVLFLLGGLTDVLDGYVARKFSLVTSWGKLADPLADKLMQITALALLTLQNKIPILILVIVIIKETFMGIGGIVLYRQNDYVVSANWYGKLATVIFYFAIVMVLFKVPHSNIFIFIAVLATLFAFLRYLLVYFKVKNYPEHEKR